MTQRAWAHPKRNKIAMAAAAAAIAWHRIAKLKRNVEIMCGQI